MEGLEAAKVRNAISQELKMRWGGGGWRERGREERRHHGCRRRERFVWRAVEGWWQASPAKRGAPQGARGNMNTLLVSRESSFLGD